MSNRTYICTRCRSARRAEAAGGLQTELRCASCGGPLWELGPRWHIPRKTDAKGWAERNRPARESFLQRRGLDLLGKIDREIAAFSARKPSSQREAILKDLQHERNEALRNYSVGGVQLETQ